MMMRAVQAKDLGPPENYALTDVPAPLLATGQVLIRVAACSLGYADVLMAAGSYQLKPPLPFIPGSEVAGVIEAAAADVLDWRPGERVMAVAPSGCLAEYLAADTAALMRVPVHLSFEEAACFRTNFATAFHALVDRANLRPGETLLVLGAAGGVGLAAVQIGQALGAMVIAAASTEVKREFAHAHGAHHTLDYRAADWRDSLKAITGGGADVVFDPVGGASFEPAFRSLAWGGRHLVVGFAGGPIPALRANLPLLKGAALVGVDIRQFSLKEPDKARANLAILEKMIGEGRLQPAVGRIFPFEAFREAMAEASSGQSCGKTVIRVFTEI